MAEFEHPLNLDPLKGAYATTEGHPDLILGESTRVDFGNGVFADVYTGPHVMKVETPIAVFTLAGVHTVEVSLQAVEFLAEHHNRKAGLTFFEDGSVMLFDAPQSATSTNIQPDPFVPPKPKSQDKTPRFRLVQPEKQTEQPETEQSQSFQVKCNLGGDPFHVTTTEGPVTVLLAYFREVNGRTIPNDKVKPVKIAVTPEEAGIITSPDLVSETNTHGYRFRSGDFMKATLTRRDFTEIKGTAEKQKETLVKGYAFVVTDTEQPTLLRKSSKHQ
jgi:hypothetical protein